MKLLFILFAVFAFIVCVCQAEKFVVLGSGGGIRAAYGFSLALTTLKSNEVLWPDVSHIKGISGSTWGMALFAQAGGNLDKLKTSAESYFTVAGNGNWGPESLRIAKAQSFYTRWKAGIESSILKIFTDYDPENHGNYNEFSQGFLKTSTQKYHFTAAGVHRKAYETGRGAMVAPLKWCEYQEGTSARCWNKTHVYATDTPTTSTIPGNEPFVDVLSVCSSAGATNKVPLLNRAKPFGRKIPIISTDMKEHLGCQYLIDGGIFNNVPFIPFEAPSKILVFEYSQSKTPLSNIFKLNEHMELINNAEEVVTQFQFWNISADSKSIVDGPQFELENLPDFQALRGGRLNAFRTATAYANVVMIVARSQKRTYYIYPFIGSTLGHGLIARFPTMEGLFGSKGKRWTAIEQTLFYTQYNTAVTTYLPLLIPKILSDNVAGVQPPKEKFDTEIDDVDVVSTFDELPEPADEYEGTDPNQPLINQVYTTQPLKKPLSGFRQIPLQI